MGMKGIFESFNNREWLEKISSCPQLKSYPVASMTLIDRPDIRRDQREIWSKFLSDTFKIYAEIPFNSHMIYKETVWRAEYPNDPFCDYYEPIARILERQGSGVEHSFPTYNFGGSTPVVVCVSEKVEFQWPVGVYSVICNGL